MLRFAHSHFVLRQHVADLAVGVVHVASNDCMFGTDDDAGWLQIQLNAMGAEVTFCGRVGVGVDVDSVVGAGLHTGFAADADLWVKFNNAICALIHGCDWADTHAGRVGAMVAAGDLKVTSHIRIKPGFNIFYPSTVDAERNFIF